MDLFESMKLPPIGRFEGRGEGYEASLLDEDSPRMTEPPLFVGKLYPPQQAVLFRMMLLEKEQVAPLVQDESYATFGDPSAVTDVLTFNAGCLTAPFAFGKTVVISALMGWERMPRKRSVPLNIPISFAAEDSANAEPADITCITAPGLDINLPTRCLQRPLFGLASACPDFTLTYCPKHHIDSTLVLVANAVISHWAETIERFVPHLSCFIIEGVDTLKEYLKLVESGDHVDYQVVLFKVGTMAWPWPWPEEHRSEQPKGPQSSFTLCDVLPNVIWSRVVIDDYDTINLSRTSYLPTAYFTWYVSATNKRTTHLDRAPGGKDLSWYESDVESSRKMLSWFHKAIYPSRPNRVQIRAASMDKYLCETLSVNCTEDFRNSQFILPRPVVREYIVEPNAVLNLLEGVEMSDEVRQALNSGAISTAAQLMGLECETASDLVSGLLTQNKKEVEEKRGWLAALQHVEYEMALASALTPGPTPVEATRIVNAIKEKKITATSDPVTMWAAAEVPKMGKSGAFTSKADTFRAKCKEVLDKSSRVLERLKENSQEGECQVCLVPWDEVEDPGGDHNDEGGSCRKFVTKCCQILVCPVCVIAPDHGYGQRKVEFVKECPNCFASLDKDGETQLLSIRDGVELDDLSLDQLSSKKNEGEEGADKGQEEAEPADPLDPKNPIEERIEHMWKTNSQDHKIRAVAQIVLGLKVTCNIERAGPPLKGLLGNDGPLKPMPKEKEVRVLIFTHLPESTRRITAALSSLQISVQVLQGRRTEKDKRIKKFKTSQAPLEVLIVTSGRDCAGIHLPETTDQIFFHKHISDAVSAQLAGRGQRYGRKYSLRVHKLFYEGEIAA